MMFVLAPGAMRLLLASLVVTTHYLDWLRIGIPWGVPIDGVAVSGFFFVSGFWIATVVVSVAVWAVIDRPLERFRRSLVEAPRPAPA
jgi:peptidoglycan/LPS O-acetylase OafA/YrhL